VRLPVKFDDEATLDASEVRIEAPHWALTAELVAAQPAISQLRHIRDSALVEVWRNERARCVLSRMA
jgi:hypothetical protein